VLGVPFWVDLVVPLGVLALTVTAAVLPALRAGRMSAVQAIATGRAPRTAHGYAAHRALARLTGPPRTVTLGLAAPFARPARTLVTVAAVVFGAASVTFGAGLATSLRRAFDDLSEDNSLPVQVSAIPADLAPGTPSSGGGQTKVIGGGNGMTVAQQRAVSAAIAAEPSTRHAVPVTRTDLSLPGFADGVSVTAYGGDPAWSGLALISGRWYSGSSRVREAVVNTLFLTDTGTSLGSTYTLTSGGHRTTVRIVGEVFRPGNDVNLYVSPATLARLDRNAGPQEYDVALRPGTNAGAYANRLSAALGSSYEARTVSDSESELTAVLTLVAMLTILITTVAGLGVLNTAALQIRERAHDIGVFKALGMTPRQTLTMIVCSVAFVGLLAGIVAVPAGVYLHHGVLPSMAHAANSGYPQSLISVYAAWEVVLLALAGLVIAVAGALGPATWAARSRTDFALRAE
jgi:putative ABC transport system permease protein